MSSSKKKVAANIVWFEIPADDLGRAKLFYAKLFGWKIAAIPGMPDYLHIDTGGPDASPDGGMMARKHPQQPPVNYVIVPSVTKAAAKVKKLGGKICMEKTAVPQMGYFIVCTDTEGNQFALWEKSEKAK
jgi:predicted enzyme related to lactoylglutathione lyase